MIKTPRQVLVAPFTDAIPASICFRSAIMPAEAIYPSHRHPWGEFVYSSSGVVEVKSEGRHFLAPPQYVIWLPPEVEHLGQNRYEACHSAVYVDRALCSVLPDHVAALAVTPLIREIFDHLRRHPPGLPQAEDEERMLRLLVDLLAKTERIGTYLPTSDDPLLGEVLAILDADPGDDRSLAELAAAANTTERTLMRRCQRDLGMTFAEWRQRLRVLKAIPLLAQGKTVESIALSFGYASSSAFITMFRRLTNETPDEYRKRYYDR